MPVLIFYIDYCTLENDILDDSSKFQHKYSTLYKEVVTSV